MKSFFKKTLIVLTILAIGAGQGLAGEENTVNPDRVNQTNPQLSEEVELPRTAPGIPILPRPGDNQFPRCWWWPWIPCAPLPENRDPIERSQPVNRQQPREQEQPVNRQ